MASRHCSFRFLILVCCLLFPIIIFPSIALAKKTYSDHGRPKALVLPVNKVLSPKIQYVTQIKQRTPLVTIKLTVDIAAVSTWVACDDGGYVSSTYKPVHCRTAECSLALKYEYVQCVDCFNGGTLNTPGCNNFTCVFNNLNGVGGRSIGGELARDTVSIQSTDGSNPGRPVSMPNLLFNCQTSYLLEGLASGVKGMVGLGNTKLGLASQSTSSLGIDRKFAICLSSSTRSKGAIFFGKGPYIFQPKKIDVSNFLTYTPLLYNSTFATYHIAVKSIKINDRIVQFDTNLLTFDQYGDGGTRISTTFPYTILNEEIHSAIVDQFVKEMGNHVPRVADVYPFGPCFNSTYINGTTPVALAVPTIQFVMQNGAVWRIYGGNSMVSVAKDVTCLAFIKSDDDDYSIVAGIFIGAYQMEDNLFQFDLANNRLGFTSSLLTRGSSCSNFNFTTNIHT